MEGLSVLQLFLFAAYVLEWNMYASSAVLEIKLEETNSCRSAAQFEWITFEIDDGLANCTVVYSLTANFAHNKSSVLDTYSLMKNSGMFTVTDLVLSQNYSIQIVCTTVESDVLTFDIEDKDCTFLGTTLDTSSVLVFQEQTSFLGTRDSVLGIVFGLFGLLIITVTTFYVVRKVRRRQRLETIRTYLGSSLIDPFANMQDREPENGSERLIESTDS